MTIEHTHVHVHELVFQLDCVLPWPGSMGCISNAAERYSSERYSNHTHKWVVDSTCVDNIAKFIEAAEASKTERIKFPAEAYIDENEIYYSPPFYPRIKCVQKDEANPPGCLRVPRIGTSKEYLSFFVFRCFRNFNDRIVEIVFCLPVVS